MTENNQAPKTISEFEKRLFDQAQSMPKRLQQCADYIISHLDRLAVSTVAEIAEAAVVQPSAVMRFCQYFGFKGFSDLQKLYRSSFTKSWPDYNTRLSNIRQGGMANPERVLAEFAEAARLSLENLTQYTDEKKLKKAVNILAKARLIHIIGLRRSFSAASYLSYAFERMEVPAIMHQTSGHLSNISTIEAKDVLIAITFSPHTQATLDLQKEAEKKGARLVIITDTPLKHSDYKNAIILPVNEIDYGAFRSFSATFVMVLTLAVSVGVQRNKTKITKEQDA